MAAPRRPRRDAEANRRRLLAAAASAMLREGRNVPLASIAAEAGVGVGTLYRSYPDRDALLQALEYRAYGLLNGILDDIEDRGARGLEAIERFLTGTCAVADQLFLPLHGAPPLVTPEAVAARRSINRRLEAFIEAGRSDGDIRAPVNATDVITFSALITQPLTHGPDWTHMADRQIAVFLNGLAADGPRRVPGPCVRAADIEDAFRRRA
ncbi:TetR/AcrR family transcriptional regulator [Streptomonospora sp. PA3]|uniref:TetR/AcrR family transcriptional regulator n=1 Tax=Streptomonospora sp. PA3 TaxID=2607326 RepID=UPI0012DBF945|nr:TetR/AcrR family transcriptional regulator [Streptomonospora sp. PA3]MUL44240.1 TetR/AcrR family transcriptional regulator [Streptomonospora sp. PA3]